MSSDQHTQSVESAGLTDVPGFQASGVSCDVRDLGDGRLDVALVFSQHPCSAAAVFTTNEVVAAPVTLNRESLQKVDVHHGVIVNSGNANAWTGAQGIVDAREMQAMAAAACDVAEPSILVCSTGHIGLPLPMLRIRNGIRHAATGKGTSSEHGINASQAILTTDSNAKRATVQVTTAQGDITIAGMAKGAGMIHPDMATMLAFIATDAKIERSCLQDMLRNAVKTSFNAITVDGDRSTNDTVIVLANGQSQITVDPKDFLLHAGFSQALHQVCSILAEKLVCDGEKITKVVEILIEGAASEADAEAIARAMGNSLLVKTSWYGNDPNWGRLMDAAGYAGARIEEFKVDLAYKPHSTSSDSTQPVAVLRSGNALSENEHLWKTIVARERFTILLNLNIGSSSYRFLATDLTEEYVDFNKSE